jgi:hypothetical protein
VARRRASVASPRAILDEAVKRFLAALAGAIGLGALLSRRWRRRESRLEPSPADELRAKLAEADERTEDGEQRPPADDAPSSSDADARRREVHGRARRALDELQ